MTSMVKHDGDSYGKALVISSPDELLSSLPYVLGFTPEESIVTVPFRAGMPVARIDMPKTLRDRREAIGVLRGAYAGNARPRELVAIVCLTADRRAAERSSRALATALAQVGVGAPMQLWATSDRWVDLDSGAAGPRTRDTAIRVAAEATSAGFAPPAPSRQALAASLVGDHRPVSAALEDARAEAHVSGAEVEQVWAAGRFAQFEDDGLHLPDSEAARMLLALGHKPIRDALWTNMSSENAGTHVAVWTDLTRRAPDQVRTPAASMLAFSSWLHGDGAKAWCALDRIPDDSPPYALAGLVARLLNAAVPPQMWAEAKSALDRSEAFVPDRPGRRDRDPAPISSPVPDRRAPGI